MKTSDMMKTPRAPHADRRLSPVSMRSVLNTCPRDVTWVHGDGTSVTSPVNDQTGEPVGHSVEDTVEILLLEYRSYFFLITDLTINIYIHVYKYTFIYILSGICDPLLK